MKYGITEVSVCGRVGVTIPKLFDKLMTDKVFARMRWSILSNARYTFTWKQMIAKEQHGFQRYRSTTTTQYISEHINQRKQVIYLNWPSHSGKNISSLLHPVQSYITCGGGRSTRRDPQYVHIKPAMRVSQKFWEWPYHPHSQMPERNEIRTYGWMSWKWRPMPGACSGVSGWTGSAWYSYIARMRRGGGLLVYLLFVLDYFVIGVIIWFQLKY